MSRNFVTPRRGEAWCPVDDAFKMRSDLYRILSRKLHAFCEHCTLHGVFYLQKGKGTVIAWSILIVAGFTLWGVLGHMIWEKYSSDPTVTVVESTYYRTEQIPFPTLMICDTLPFYGPKTKNLSHILYSRGYSGSQIDAFYDSFTDVASTDYMPPPYIRKMHALMQDLGFTVEFILEMYRKPCNVTLVNCRWKSVEYDCSNMFLEVTTVVGHCCQFDISHFKKFANSNTKFEPGNQVTEGLEVTLNGAKVYPNETVKQDAVLMYVLDPADKVSWTGSSIALAPGSYFEVRIEVYAIDTSPEIKALSLKTRKCSLSTDQGIGASFYQNCISTLMVRRVVNQCKCIPFMFSAEELSVKDFPNCNWERYLCITAQLELTFADMHSLIRMNDCYQRCDYVEYDPKVQFIRKLNTGKSENYTKLAVHYASRTCMKYRREIIYTWDLMFANLGGIFGLCLGGSIISLIEIVWFLIDLLVTTINNLKAKPKQKEKKIMFVDEKNTKKHDRNENGCYKFTN